MNKLVWIVSLYEYTGDNSRLDVYAERVFETKSLAIKYIENLGYKPDIAQAYIYPDDGTEVVREYSANCIVMEFE